MSANFGYSKYAAAVAFVAVFLCGLTTAFARERRVFSFSGNNGANPGYHLIFDSAGNIYGVTANGGGNTSCGGTSCGVIFKLTQTSSGSWTETVLHRFFAGYDGDVPNFLIFDSTGDLYGTTFWGGGKGGQCNGRTGCGVGFKLTPTASGPWTETILYRCGGGDCAQPNSLAFDSAGNLYSTASGGGGSSFCADAVTLAGCGVLFQLSPTSSGPWTLIPLHTFLDSPTDAQGPLGLTVDSRGIIYGITSAGGPGGGRGTVFELSPSSGGWNISYLHSFGGTGDGDYPTTGFIMDPVGNFYGTTPEGGANNGGVVWELSPDAGGTWTENVLYSFKNGVDGIVPQAGLALDTAGNLYGTTYYGGGTNSQCQNGCGTIFKLVPSGSGTWTESVVFRFSLTNSQQHPASPLLPDALGNFYGTVVYGGPANDGQVFSYTP